MEERCCAHRPEGTYHFSCAPDHDAHRSLYTCLVLPSMMFLPFVDSQAGGLVEAAAVVAGATLAIHTKRATTSKEKSWLPLWSMWGDFDGSVLLLLMAPAAHAALRWRFNGCALHDGCNCSSGGWLQLAVVNFGQLHNKERRPEAVQ